MMSRVRSKSEAPQVSKRTVDTKEVNTNLDQAKNNVSAEKKKDWIDIFSTSENINEVFEYSFEKITNKEFDILIPFQLKNKIDVKDTELPKNNWTKEFKWMCSFYVNQDEIMQIVDEEIKKAENKIESKTEINRIEKFYLKKFIEFILSKLENSFPSIVVEPTKIKIDQQRLRLINKELKASSNCIEQNFKSIINLFLNRFIKGSRLKDGFKFIRTNCWETKHGNLILKEKYLKKLFTDFKIKNLREEQIAQIVVIFFLFMRLKTDPSFILTQYEQYIEILQKPSPITKSEGNGVKQRVFEKWKYEKKIVKRMHSNNDQSNKENKRLKTNE